METMDQGMEIRTVERRSPSARRETLWVGRGVVTVGIVSALLAGLGRGSADADVPLGTYQVRFRDASPEVQRMARELWAGLEDVIRLRTPKDEWPGIRALEEDLVGPFAGIRGWTWEFRQRGPFIGYLGRPEPGTDHPAYLLHLQENVPHPGRVALDEFHRRLGDGTIVHVGVWFHRAPGPGPEAIRMPEREGWTEVVQGRTRLER